MNTIFILRYNNLGADFWCSHLEIDDSSRVLFFNNGTTFLSQIKREPGLIIIDNYFCNHPQEDHSFDDLRVALTLCTPHLPVFFFSPEFSGKTKKSMHMNHFYSTLDSQVISVLNSFISEKSKNKLVA